MEELRKAFDNSFIVITCLIIFLTIYGFFNSGLFLLVVFFLFSSKHILDVDLASDTYQFTLFDIAIAMIAVVEVISYLTSIYRENSYYSIADISYFILFYYWIKFNLKHEYQIRAIYIFITVLGVFLFIDGIIGFSSNYSQMLSAGLSNINDFKNAFSFGAPIGTPTAEWSTLYLVCLPFSIMLFFIKYKKEQPFVSTLYLLLPIIILVIPVISCFRGMYIAIAAFFVVASILFIIYKLSSLKIVLFFNAAIILPLAIIFLISPVRDSVLSTASMFRTTSQIRSYEGRENLWKTGFMMIKEHPLTGIGSNNFAIEYGKYKDQNDNAPFAGRIFNFFLQLAVEKGLPGIAAYCFLIISFFYVSHRKIKYLKEWNEKASVILMMSAFAAILVRDLSYSSILYNKGAHLLIWFIFAHNTQSPYGKKEPRHITLYSKLKIIIPFLLFGLIFLIIAINSLKKEKAESYYLDYIESINHNNYIRAKENIESAIRLAPNNAYYLSSDGLTEERLIDRIFNVDTFLAHNYVFNETEVRHIEASINYYRQAVMINPSDDEFYYNLGWLYLFNKAINKSEYYFQYAIQLNHSIPVYHIGLGMFYEYVGNIDSAFIEYGQAIQQQPSILDSPFYCDLQKRFPDKSVILVRHSIDSLENIYTLKNDPLAGARLAKLYLFCKEYEKSKILLKSVTSTLPNLPRPWLYLGDLYQFTDTNEMLRCYQKAALLDQADLYPALRLGEYYEQHNQVSEAIKYYKNVISASLIQHSFHASKTSAMYNFTCKDQRSILNNYLIPDGFLSYCSMNIKLSNIYEHLSELYSKQGNIMKANEYKSLSEREEY
ncbi:MAG: O-antigen ligase family protein [Bacteroidetes bacterium]|nr:O-antigen ligase family protein [Bacteroidota bacterium]